MSKQLIHSIEFPIRWGDMDAYGHVNNINYFLFVQEARFDLLQKAGFSAELSSVAPVLASIYCKFISPMKYPEIIIVETYFVKTVEKKVFFEHTIKSKDLKTVYAILEATIVWFDFHQNASVMPPLLIQEYINKQ